MKKQKMLSVGVGVLLGVCTLVFAAALGLFLIHISDWLYRMDVKALSIAEETGYSRELILRNYNAVMDFLSPFSKSAFSLPDLTWSASGAFHFEECKVIFTALYACGGAAGLLIAGFAVFLCRRVRLKTVLGISAVTTVVLPAVVFAAVAVDFDRAFIWFHKIFFNNDAWLFDASTDPIIQILPSSFFLHCAVFICAVIVFAALAELLLRRYAVSMEDRE